MQHLSGNQRPDLLTALMNMSLGTAPATEKESLQILFTCPTTAIVFGNTTKPSRFARCWQGPQFLAPATRNDIWTSKSGSSTWCFWHFDFEMCFAPQRHALFRHRNFQKWSDHGGFCTFWLRNLLRATTACTFSTSQLPKVVRPWCVLYILTSKCASRHNGVHLFDIAISKSGPNMVCFVHFDFEMCFPPQRHALFRHLNFQKWSEHGVFCTFWLRHVLRATAACTFSTSQFPKVVRAWCVLYILTWKCASHHNGVQFLISHLASGLRTRRFSEPTFRPSRASNPIGKTHGVSRLCYLFAHLDLLSSDSFSFFFSSLLFSSHLISSLLFSSLALPISAFHFLSSLLFSSLPFPSLLFFSLLFSSLLWLFPSLLLICP